jgi:hypothetical protein
MNDFGAESGIAWQHNLCRWCRGEMTSFSPHFRSTCRSATSNLSGMAAWQYQCGSSCVSFMRLDTVAANGRMEDGLTNGNWSFASHTDRWWFFRAGDGNLIKSPRNYINTPLGIICPDRPVPILLPGQDVRVPSERRRGTTYLANNNLKNNCNVPKGPTT